MYWMAALKSASEAVEPPLGGMAPMPCVAFFTMASMPSATKGPQAALSPNLGAPATPVPWQTAQVCSYRALPASLLAAGAALAASGVAAGAAAGVAATGGVAMEIDEDLSSLYRF